jgi:NADH-quinone oxidoreductase subunit G
METVTLTIDGKEITVEKGRTVLQAAIQHGIAVPYYCYHPGLGIDGSCRVCMVKIEKMPKLQTSCSTVCTDGMVVETQTPDVVEARASVLEFLLLNHPLDCPVCDKGGECPLQDFAYSFGPQQSRMRFARRTFDGDGVKADIDFGPTLMLNRNRCILCTRCVRFMNEVDGDAQINIIERGSGSAIATFREEGVHSLLSGNLMDVCPVGALTTKDYRFKSRPWDNPTAADTICTLCSKGCNTTFWIKAKPEWARGARLARVTPRFNPDVNGYWMCDIGRFEYHWVEGDGRLRQPLIRTAGGSQDAPWNDALREVARRLSAATRTDPRSARFLVSAHASNEEMFLVANLARQLELPAPVASWQAREKRQPATSQFTIPAQDAPNVRGARDLGLTTVETPGGSADLSELRRAVESGDVSFVFVLDPGPAGSIGALDWMIEARRAGTLATLIVQATVDSALGRAADVVLPGACFVEKDGSYTNDHGRVQGGSRVLDPVGDALEDWEILTRLAELVEHPTGCTSAHDVRRALAAAMADTPSYASLTSLEFARPIPARNWLQASNPSERWKWEVMFRDLPPVKGASPVPAVGPNTIPLEPID